MSFFPRWYISANYLKRIMFSKDLSPCLSNINCQRKDCGNIKKKWISNWLLWQHMAIFYAWREVTLFWFLDRFTLWFMNHLSEVMETQTQDVHWITQRMRVSVSLCWLYAVSYWVSHYSEENLALRENSGYCLWFIDRQQIHPDETDQLTLKMDWSHCELGALGENSQHLKT